MANVASRGYTFGTTELVTNAKLHALVDNATLTVDTLEAGVVPVKATGAELNTGTDDAKFATAKALVDSDYIKSSDVLALIYPVGIVVTLGVSTNPATLFGIGTWSAIAGRVIVGINAGDSEFDTLDETGGAKTHTLQTTEIPSHSHTIGAGDRTSYPGMTGAGSNSAYGTIATSSVGGGEAHNNLQPYIVKYVWQRTA